jgi:hypothetical protein
MGWIFLAALGSATAGVVVVTLIRYAFERLSLR